MTLKSDKAAEDHIKQFMPKLSGLDAVGMSKSFSLFSITKYEETLVDYVAFGSFELAICLRCTAISI